MARFLVGGLIPAAGFVVYFIAEGALKEFIDAYLLINARYTTPASLLSDFAAKWIRMQEGYGITLWVIMAGLLALPILTIAHIIRGRWRAPEHISFVAITAASFVGHRVELSRLQLMARCIRAPAPRRHRRRCDRQGDHRALARKGRPGACSRLDGRRRCGRCDLLDNPTRRSSSAAGANRSQPCSTSSPLTQRCFRSELLTRFSFRVRGTPPVIRHSLAVWTGTSTTRGRVG